MPGTAVQLASSARCRLRLRLRLLLRNLPMRGRWLLGLSGRSPSRDLMPSVSFFSLGHYLGLEIKERPSKRPFTDLANLSISDPDAGKVPQEFGTKKLFVQHLETVRHSVAIKDVLHSFLVST
ncbi:RNA-directed DNA methylation 4 [Canna indica]|uniref:RNA-directed DNA methylation 4 n=1 Tax=Canna indica TaxID=4628 RepID=A0AAQ3JZ42_9LILI|nr:RNA-directed DNA methylation 4 [Canna indica]